MKSLWRGISFLVVTGLLATVLANAWVIGTTRTQVFRDAESLPNSDVAVVLGTSKRTISGEVNPWFEKRIQAAVELFQQGKVTHFVLSGHNPSRYYNEPRDMQKALTAAGVPASAIELDTAGSRTYESILRIRELHPKASVTIITQEFHGYRALFIANHLGVEAVAFAANNTTISRSFDILLREYFARIKAVGEVYLRQPAIPQRDTQ